MRRVTALTLVITAISLISASTQAATLGAGLERRLAAFGAGDSISLILTLADQADLRAYRGSRADAGAVIGRLHEHADRSQPPVVALLESRGYSGKIQSFWITNSIAVRVAASLLPVLAGRADVARLDYDEPVGFGDVPGPVVPVGPLNGSMDWNLPMVGADQVWKTYGLDGTGIVVGSLDTGFDPNHPALQGKWRGGTNSWRDFVQALPNPYDDHGHGTHTIGTMVGGDGPGPFSPDIGLAYNARFISGKVLDAGNSFSSASTVIAGAQWMLDPDNNPATDDFPNVINNSWLFFAQDFLGFHDAVTAWRAAGIVPVFCLGNNGPAAATSNPPGNYDNTIGVGATDSGDLIASFSSRGPSPAGFGFPADQRKPDLSAPGSSVLSSIPGGGYQFWFGTSMAAPHVAGAVALMMQAHPSPMSIDEVRAALIATAVDRGAIGYDDNFGYGRLDAFAAVTEALIPGVHVAAAVVGHDARLSWSPSPRADLLRYDVYSSPEADDSAPALVGTTQDTTFTDPDRWGREYYRVRAVRQFGLSPLSNEVNVTICAPAAPACYAVGTFALSPVAVDLNGDGHLDIALSNTTPTGTVTIALGSGAGTFGPIASFPAGSRPMGIGVGDFNGDGIRDLAVADNVTAGTVAVLLGNGAAGVGDGTFAAPVTYATNQKPVGVVTGDFDQDGITDLAVANNAVSSVSILRGLGSAGAGNGTFAPAVHYAAALRPNGIVSGDFNHDGALDLAVASNGAARVSVLIGNQTEGKADGTFGTAMQYVCGGSPWNIASGDFNEDGIVDLAVTISTNPGLVSILRGQGSAGVGDGTFATGVTYDANAFPMGLTTADMNGDGITDVCVANGSTDGIASVLLGTGSGGIGDGGFERAVGVNANSTLADLTVADFDEDGAPDLAVASTASLQNLCVLRAVCGSSVGTGLTLQAPNGGESWPASTDQVIAWTKDPGVVSVDVDVSRDNGGTWQRIATQQTGTAWHWWVTDPPTGAASARVRVSDSRVGSEDVSDAGFTVAPDARLGAPSGTGPGDVLALAVGNPSLDRLRIRCVVGIGASATLEVVDVSGRRVLARAIAPARASEQVFELGEGLRAGVYLVRLTRDGERITRKATVLR